MIATPTSLSRSAFRPRTEPVAPTCARMSPDLLEGVGYPAVAQRHLVTGPIWLRLERKWDVMSDGAH